MRASLIATALALALAFASPVVAQAQESNAPDFDMVEEFQPSKDRLVPLPPGVLPRRLVSWQAYRELPKFDWKDIMISALMLVTIAQSLALLVLVWVLASKKFEMKVDMKAPNISVIAGGIQA